MWERLSVPNPRIVWLTEERTYAELMRRGAHFSLVRYSRGGYDYEILVENDEFVDKGNDDDPDED
jgi:hypothetical protein